MSKKLSAERIGAANVITIDRPDGAVRLKRTRLRLAELWQSRASHSRLGERETGTQPQRDGPIPCQLPPTSLHFEHL